MTVGEELVWLRAEVGRLVLSLAESRQVTAEQGQVIAEQRQVIEGLERRIAELEQGSDKHPPVFVKVNRPKVSGPKQPRAKRDAKHNQARRREPPTRTVEHAFDRCPECDYQLGGKSVGYVRQVIEIPEPKPVEVVEHRVIKRYCPHCERWRSPKLELAGQVLGRGRMGIRLVSLIAYSRATLRQPLRQIQAYLKTFHQLVISEGEIVYLLDQVREATKETVEGFRGQAQRSEVLHADETGWREAGRNGYIWAFSTEGAEAVRYYEYDPSRAQSVVRRILGDKFHGHLVSDFYCGYNDYECKKQRCWTHLLRALHELKEKCSEDLETVKWAQGVRALYDEAQGWLGKAGDRGQEEREQKYVELVSRVHALGLEHARDKPHPCCALCKRLLRHEDELFQFVLVEGLSASNNLAERSIRPLVVIRKISGGTRGPSGSKTRMALATLFGTWQARGLNPFIECFTLLSRRTPSPA